MTSQIRQLCKDLEEYRFWKDSVAVELIWRQLVRAADEANAHLFTMRAALKKMMDGALELDRAINKVQDWSGTRVDACLEVVNDTVREARAILAATAPEPKEPT